MSISGQNVFVRTGMYLDNTRVQSRTEYQGVITTVYEERSENLLVRGYLNNVTLSVLTGAGIIIAGAGILALLASFGHLTSLVALVHAGSIPSSTLMIAGAAAIGGGGVIAIAHGTIIGLREYANYKID